VPALQQQQQQRIAFSPYPTFSTPGSAGSSRLPPPAIARRAGGGGSSGSSATPPSAAARTSRRHSASSGGGSEVASFAASAAGRPLTPPSPVDSGAGGNDENRFCAILKPDAARRLSLGERPGAVLAPRPASGNR